jgi:hypothetical protein
MPVRPNVFRVTATLSYYRVLGPNRCRDHVDGATNICVMPPDATSLVAMIVTSIGAVSPKCF